MKNPEHVILFCKSVQPKQGTKQIPEKKLWKKTVCELENLPAKLTGSKL